MRFEVDLNQILCEIGSYMGISSDCSSGVEFRKLVQAPADSS